MKKLVPAILIFFLSSMLAIAVDGEPVCENCAKEGNAYNCNNVCTFEFKYVTGVKTLRLSSGASVTVSSKGFPESIKLTKEPKEQQNINGYLVQLLKQDWITFVDGDIDNFVVHVEDAMKDKAGALDYRELCAQKFDAVAGDKAKGLASLFSIYRVKKGASYACELNSYTLYNMKDAKAPESIYNYKCGDISYSSYGEGLKGVTCEPLLKLSTNPSRSSESRLYCKLGDKECAESYFSFDVGNKMSKDLLSVQFSGKASSKFSSVVRKAEPKTSRVQYVTSSERFLIGGKVYKPDDQSRTMFIEDDYPLLYVSGGIEMEAETGYGSKVTYRYLPEFSSPTDSKFEGYYFRFDPKLQYPLLVYPAGFDLSKWNPSNFMPAKQGSEYVTGHMGLASRVRYENGYITYTSKDGKEATAPKDIVVEWRVNTNPSSEVKVSECTGPSCKSPVTATKGKAEVSVGAGKSSLPSVNVQKVQLCNAQAPCGADKDCVSGICASKPLQCTDYGRPKGKLDMHVIGINMNDAQVKNYLDATMPKLFAIPPFSERQNVYNIKYGTIRMEVPGTGLSSIRSGHTFISQSGAYTNRCPGDAPDLLVLMAPTFTRSFATPQRITMALTRGANPAPLGNVLAHESAHAIANIRDEYYEFASGANGFTGVNCNTIEEIKSKKLWDEDTIANAQVYGWRGCGGSCDARCNGYFRPSETSIMRKTAENNFNRVSYSQILSSLNNFA
ncbi:MAG: hypothetical protein V1906_01900 [Candidatus Woesearchaeota archaeon]